MNNQTILYIFTALFLFVSCSDSSNEPQPPQLASVYVMNEGNFSDANGSVTSYNPQTGNSLQQVFEKVNDRPLAGIIQAAAVIGERMFIVLNSADKIEVVDARSFTSIGTIELSKTPAAIIPAGDEKAYVSNLYANSLSIVDLERLRTTGTIIPVGSNPQAMARVGNYVYVANNGFGNANTISVIDTQTDAVKTTLAVGHGPVDLTVDQANRVWVVCNGLIAYDENYNRAPEDDLPGSVHVINGETAALAGVIQTGGHPSDLALNEQSGQGYLLNDGIWIIDLNRMDMETTPLSTRDFNAIAYSPYSNLIYAGQSRGFTQRGQAIRYEPEGTAVDSFTVGIAPREFKFIKN